MKSVKIYHNPSCSKCRQALELLESCAVETEVVRYLDTPPDRAELEALLALLQVSPRAIMRDTEEEYHALGLQRPDLDRETLVQALLDHPRLLQRPIVICDGRAIIGRPPEKILEIL